MAKIAALFAGQGAQHPCMGLDLYDNSPQAKGIFKRAERIVPGIIKMCFNGEQETLDQTINTQPCVFTVDMAAFAAYAAYAGYAVYTSTGTELHMQGAAGFSLGEYAALTAARVMPFEDALQLVVLRARWMDEASKKYPGGMAALLKKTSDEALEIVNTVRGDGLLEAVNFNCPNQTVIAGDDREMRRLQEYAEENFLMLKTLPVSGAFHTTRMDDAADKLYKILEELKLDVPTLSLYSNKTGKQYEFHIFARTLADQTNHPVMFEAIIKNMIQDGFDTFIEFGPGKTLTSFVKRIDKNVSAYHIEDIETLRATITALDKQTGEHI